MDIKSIFSKVVFAVITLTNSLSMVAMEQPGRIQSTLLERYGDLVNVAAFSPDGKSIVIPSRSLEWTNEHTRIIEGKEFCSADLSPDASLILMRCLGGIVQLLDAKTGECRHILKIDMRDSWSFCFSPDSSLVVTIDYDGAAYIWNTQTGDVLNRVVPTPFNLIDGIRNGVREACFSPDGSLVVTVDWGGTICIWDIQAGKCLYTLVGPSGRTFQSFFSMDGNLLVTMSTNGSLDIWRDTLAKKRLRENALTLAQGFHGRLGGDSPVQLLDQETLKGIVKLTIANSSFKP